MKLSAIILVAAPILDICLSQTANILEHPQTQCVLVGDLTTFNCKTFGRDAFWLINDQPITKTHPHNKERYESLGFSFNDLTHGSLGYHNLTMNVSASESINNTVIECRVLDRNWIQIESNAAYLNVFTDFTLQVINYTVFYYRNGTPVLFLQIKPPNNVCLCQRVMYTIEIKDIDFENFETIGPFHHRRHKNDDIVQKSIRGIFQRNHNYTMVVALQSRGVIYLSKIYHFNTTLTITSEPCYSHQSEDVLHFQLGMSVSLFVAVLMMLILIILALSSCIYYKRDKVFIPTALREAQNHAVIHGPVYESIHSNVDTLITTSHIRDIISHQCYINTVDSTRMHCNNAASNFNMQGGIHRI